MNRLVLDAGALIALERDDRPTWGRLARLLEREGDVVTHAGIVGQVWRAPTRQVRLARALKFIDVQPLTIELAKSSGVLLAATKTSDVHDACLALLCEPGDSILTGDVDDLASLLLARGLSSVNVIHV